MNLEINLNKEAQYIASNNRISIYSGQAEFREEEIVHLLKDAMNIEQ
jgi:hypothetical protein